MITTIGTVPVMGHGISWIISSRDFQACHLTTSNHALYPQLTALQVFDLPASFTVDNSVGGRTVCEDPTTTNSEALLHHALGTNDLRHTLHNCVQLSVCRAQCNRGLGAGPMVHEMLAVK